MRKLFMVLLSIVFIFLSGCASISDNHSNSGYALVEFKKSYNYKTLTDYLSFNKNQMITKLGSEFKSRNIATEQSNIMLFSHFYKKIGVSFIYGVNEGDSEVLYIECNDKVDILGAKSGMSFEEIQDKLGKSEVQKTWVGNKEVLAYKIQYRVGKLMLKFISYDKRGKEAALDVYRN